MAAILDAVKHPYVPFDNPERLAYVARFGGPRVSISEADWRETLGSASFVEATTFTVGAYSLVESGDYANDRIMRFVTPDFFTFLGVKPQDGRYFGGSGDNEAVVISDRLRRAAFPGRKSAVGGTLSVGNRTYTVIGVTPAGFERAAQSDLWFLLSGRPGTTGSIAPNLNPLIRIRPGVRPGNVREEVAGLAKRLTEKYVGGNAAIGLRLDSFRPDPQNFRLFHAALAAAGLIVLLVACGNVANLLLARALERRPEHVLRIALGALPMQVARQAIAESLVLATAGCVGGMLLAVWFMNIVAAYRPTNLEWLGILDPHLSWRVFAFAASASIMIAVASAVVPMIRIARTDPGEVLKSGAGTMTRVARRRDGLVIGQLSLALTLLFCTGLLAKSALAVARYDFGFDPTPLANAQIYFLKDSINTDSAFRELVGHASRLPGVRSAGFQGWMTTERGIVTADEHTDSAGILIKRSAAVVDPGFFQTVRVPVIAGRDFLPGDVESGAAVIDEEAARRLWHGDSVIGRHLKLGDQRSARPWLRVVGVVRLARLGVPSDPDLPPEPGVFVVQRELPRGGNILVRSDAPAIAANGLRRLLREHLRQRGRNYYANFSSWASDSDARTSARGFMAGLFAVFAGFTLLLALAGIYGTLTYSVSRRMREFAVRSALGATTAQLRKLVLNQALIAILAATAIGGPAGIFAARLLDSWLYGVWYSDATVLLAAEALLILTSFVVCLPALQRTGRLAPSRLLKEL